MMLQVMSVSIDHAQEALIDPTATVMERDSELHVARQQAAKERAMNAVLHKDLRQLQRDLEDQQEEAARRQTINRMPPLEKKLRILLCSCEV
jgi:hypothetical protein